MAFAFLNSLASAIRRFTQAVCYIPPADSFDYGINRVSRENSSSSLEDNESSTEGGKSAETEHGKDGADKTAKQGEQEKQNQKPLQQTGQTQSSLKDEPNQFEEIDLNRSSQAPVINDDHGRQQTLVTRTSVQATTENSHQTAPDLNIISPTLIENGSVRNMNTTSDVDESISNEEDSHYSNGMDVTPVKDNPLHMQLQDTMVDRSGGLNEAKVSDCSHNEFVAKDSVDWKGYGNMDTESSFQLAALPITVLQIVFAKLDYYDRKVLQSVSHKFYDANFLCWQRKRSFRLRKDLKHLFPQEVSTQFPYCSLLPLKQQIQTVLSHIREHLIIIDLSSPATATTKDDQSKEWGGTLFLDKESIVEVFGSRPFPKVEELNLRNCLFSANILHTFASLFPNTQHISLSVEKFQLPSNELEIGWDGRRIKSTDCDFYEALDHHLSQRFRKWRNMKRVTSTDLRLCLFQISCAFLHVASVDLNRDSTLKVKKHGREVERRNELGLGDEMENGREEEQVNA